MEKKAPQQTEDNALILPPFPQSSGCHPAGQESHSLSQHTTVPAWSSRCHEDIAVLPPQLAGLGMREEKQAWLRVRGVLQTLAYHEQMEFQKNMSKPCRTKLEVWCNCKSLHKSSEESTSVTSIPHGEKQESEQSKVSGGVLDCVWNSNSVGPWPKRSA